jgi:hypothetical protein
VRFKLFEAEREHVRALKGTAAFARSARERRKVEIAFAHLKRHLGFRRLRLRGITGCHGRVSACRDRPEFTKAGSVLGYRPPIPSGCPA